MARGRSWRRGSPGARCLRRARPAWTAAFQVDVSFLLPLAAGNFTYIAASDLVPEMAHTEGASTRGISVPTFLCGLGVFYLLA